MPDAADIKLGNDAVKLKATVLYADLADSTDLVNSHSATFAAEIFKAYLHCAAKLIRYHGGEITAYDGDRIMAVYIGTSKNTDAAKTGLRINWAVQKVINPAIANQYPNIAYRVSQAVGIDTSDILVARTGVRGANDLVWVGRAANYAAKLSAERSAGYATFITEDIYSGVHESAREPMAETCGLGSGGTSETLMPTSPAGTGRSDSRFLPPSPAERGGFQREESRPVDSNAASSGR